MNRMLGPGPTTMPTTSLSSIVPSKYPSCSPSQRPAPAPSPMATQQPSIRSPSQSHHHSLKPTVVPSQFSVGGIAGLSIGCIFICALWLAMVAACRWYRKPADKSEVCIHICACFLDDINNTTTTSNHRTVSSVLP